MLNDYAKFVDTTTSNESKSEYAFGEHFMRLGRQHPDIGWSRLMTSAIGMLAESGEFAEVMKKILFQGKEMNEDVVKHLRSELGDIMWYVAQGCVALGTSIEELIDINTAKLESRYPGGFEAFRSENRSKDDI